MIPSVSAPLSVDVSVPSPVVVDRAPPRTRRIYTVGYDGGYSSWMEGTGVARSMEDADLVVLTGGGDVSPARYGSPCHPSTYPSPERDEIELRAIAKAVSLGKPIWGTCRGIQIGAVAAGLKLVQHQSHPSMHPIKTYDGRQIEVTSCHHQAVHCHGVTPDVCRLLGWGEGLSEYHFDGDGNEMPGAEVEAEICYLPKLRLLGAQSHPEFAYPARRPAMVEMITYMRTLLDRLMTDTL